MAKSKTSKKKPVKKPVKKRVKKRALPKNKNFLPKLTPKQLSFINHYMVNGFNATAALRSAKYKGNPGSLAVTGHRMLRKANVRAEINKQMALLSVDPAEVLGIQASIARGLDLTDYLSFRDIYILDEGERYLSGSILTIDLDGLKRDGHGHLIKSIKQTVAGTISIDFHDPQRALTDIAKALGMFITVNLLGKVEDQPNINHALSKLNERFDHLGSRKNPGD